MRLSHHRLSTTEDRLAVINRFASLVLDTSSEEEVVWLIAKNAIADLGFDDCVVYLKDSSRKFSPIICSISNQKTWYRVTFIGFKK